MDHLNQRMNDMIRRAAGRLPAVVTEHDAAAPGSVDGSAGRGSQPAPPPQTAAAALGRARRGATG